jgi:hypothetical protein
MPRKQPKSIMAECSFPNPPIDWESVAEWSVAVLHEKGLKSSLIQSWQALFWGMCGSNVEAEQCIVAWKNS